jgi:hypothetical protein
MAVKYLSEEARHEDIEWLRGAKGNVLLPWRNMRAMKCVEEMGLMTLQVCLSSLLLMTRAETDGWPDVK